VIFARFHANIQYLTLTCGQHVALIILLSKQFATLSALPVVFLFGVCSVLGFKLDNFGNMNTNCYKENGSF